MIWNGKEYRTWLETVCDGIGFLAGYWYDSPTLSRPTFWRYVRGNAGAAAVQGAR